MPHDYREFLLNVGNGGAGPGCGLFSLERALFGHEENYQHRIGTEIRKTVARPYLRPNSPDFDFRSASNGLLVLCHNGCGYDDFLVVTGQDRGTIWRHFEAAGHHIPLLNNMPNSLVQDGVDDMSPEYDELERAWIRSLLKASGTEQLTFADWYLNWLYSKPHIVRREDMLKLIADLGED